METVVAIVLLAGTTLFIVHGEATIRRLDRRHAQEFPAKIAVARTEYKLERRAEDLRSHLTREDLQFLATNGSDFARTQLKAIEAPRQKEEPRRKEEPFADSRRVTQREWKRAHPEVVFGRNSGRPVQPIVQASAILGKLPKDRTTAEAYFLRQGHWPWEPPLPEYRNTTS